VVFFLPDIIFPINYTMPLQKPSWRILVLQMFQTFPIHYCTFYVPRTIYVTQDDTPIDGSILSKILNYT